MPARYRAYRAPRARAKRADRNARAKCVKTQETKKEAKKGDRNFFRSPWRFRSRFAIYLVDLIGKHDLQLFHDLLFRMSLGDREFLDQQAARRVEHLALTERQLLVTLEHQQVAQDLGDLERRAGLNFFSVLAV